MKFTKSSQIINGLSSALQQWLDETLAVLVLYKTPLSESITFVSLNQSLKKNNSTIDWFVYDNSPISNQDFKSSQDLKIIVRLDTSNPGVSKAYNEGFKVAKSLGKKWMLLLDQDTQFPSSTVEKYHEALNTYGQESCFVPQLVDQVGIISPFKFRLGNGIRISSVMDGVQFFDRIQFVNSGLMISVNAFSQAGGYDEDFPLDFSDYAFIERIRTQYRSFVLVPLTAHHGHSSQVDISLQVELKRFNTFVTASKVFRKKYHPRNTFVVLRPLLRALKLSIRHRTLVFIKQYFDSMSHG